MKRTALKTFIIFAFIVLTLESCTLIIDPFYRFNIVSIPTINEQRSVFAYAGRMAKAENICRVRPEQIVIGGSKGEVGIDPHNPAWGVNEISEPFGVQYPPPPSVYNMGLAGMPLSEMDKTLRFIARNAPLKRAVLALDFMQFNQLRENVVYKTEVVDFDADRISGSCAYAFVHDWNYLVGPQALKYSLATMVMQRDAENGGDNSLVNGILALPELLGKGGTEALYWHGEQDTSAADGAYFAILFDDLGYRSHFSIAYHNAGGTMDGFGGYGQEEYYIEKIWRPAPKHSYEFGATFEQLDAMLRFARFHDIDLRLTTEPLHARMLMAIEDAGLQPQFEQWKRDLAAVAAAAGFPLWDFEAYNWVTEDQAYWWEPSHYKKQTGDLILDRVLRAPEDGDFGKLLTPDNVEEWLVVQRAAARHYKASHPDIANALAATVRASMDKTPTQ